MPHTTGALAMRNPLLNRGRALDGPARAALGVVGLVPPGQLTGDQQVALLMEGIARRPDELAQYEYLLTVLHDDANLFFRALRAHTEKLMPIVYTPVVGAACLAWGRLLAPRACLYISLDDAGHVAERLASWPAADVRAIVVTDGERILGLGDLGANGMGIPLGKLALYTALAGVNPALTLPVTLDVGTNNEALLADEFYSGLRRPRERGPAYDALVHEFVTGVKARWGPDVLLQWEDFGNTNAFRLSLQYKDVLPSFNDDVEGTASVVVAGIMSAAANVPKVPRISEGTYLFYGAGEAGVGISDLLAYAMAVEVAGGVAAATKAIAAAHGGEVPSGTLLVSEAEIAAQRHRIWLVDSRGLVTAARAAAEADFAHHKIPYAHAWPPANGCHGGAAAAAAAVAPGAVLDAVVAALRPTALIGVSAQPAAFTQAVVEAMAAAQAAPLVFALSNPTSKSECTAQEAIDWSRGTAVFASGSPFAPVVKPDGSTYVPGQGNNSYIFPAVGVATLAARIQRIDTQTMYIAAAALCATASKDAVAATGNIYPPLSTIMKVSGTIAAAVVNDAYDRGLAQRLPRPADAAALVAEHTWTPA